MRTSPGIKVSSKGSFKNMTDFLKRLKEKRFLNKVEEYAELGKQALMDATPVDTGKTQQSWDYKIKHGPESTTIIWENSNRAPNGIPIVLLLVYGHGTRRGGYVQGHDFITPAIEPIFDEIADGVWLEVIEYAK